MPTSTEPRTRDDPAPILTLAAMEAADPRLAELLAEAREQRPPRNENPWPLYTRLKRRLSQLVGWYAADRRLASSQAYDAALHALTQALGV